VAILDSLSFSELADSVRELLESPPGRSSLDSVDDITNKGRSPTDIRERREI